MQILIQLSVIYIIGGSAGWLLELFFRRFAHGKWINPGFLVGPNLPLYGTGLIALYLLCSGNYSFIPSYGWRCVFLIAVITLTMTVVEYVTGLFFLKRMHVKLWDYSNRWGNIQGIICPLFSFFWGLIGTGYYFLLHGWMRELTAWIAGNPMYSYFLGMYFGIMTVDVCYSFGVVGKIRKWAKDKQSVVRYEELKLFIKSTCERLKERSSFVLSFKSRLSLRELLENYRDQLQQKLVKAHKKDETAPLPPENGGN